MASPNGRHRPWAFLVFSGYARGDEASHRLLLPRASRLRLPDAERGRRWAGCVFGRAPRERSSPEASSNPCASAIDAVLAGGSCTRCWPATRALCTQGRPDVVEGITACLTANGVCWDLFDPNTAGPCMQGIIDANADAQVKSVQAKRTSLGCPSWDVLGIGRPRRDDERRRPREARHLCIGADDLRFERAPSLPLRHGLRREPLHELTEGHSSGTCIGSLGRIGAGRRSRARGGGGVGANRGRWMLQVRRPQLAPHDSNLLVEHRVARGSPVGLRAHGLHREGSGGGAEHGAGHHAGRARHRPDDGAHDRSRRCPLGVVLQVGMLALAD